MDDEQQKETTDESSSPKADETAESRQIDLSDLQGFSIGPSWGDPDFTESSKKQAASHPVQERRKSYSARPPARSRDRARTDRRPAGRREGSGEDRRSGHRFESRPPFNPIVEVGIYPEDAPFRALSQAIRHSCRTYELFELARLILEKPERLVVVVSPFSDASKGIREFYISVPDNLPFESEEAAVNHVMNSHVDKFFDLDTIEIDPPKGVFKSVNRCTITGELLGPPNYHRYSQLEQTHHASRLSKMSLERFRSKIETVTDPDVIDGWLQKMRTQTRYTLKSKPKDESPPPSFETPESAWRYLLTQNRKKIVTVSSSARFSGKMLTALPPHSGIRRSVELTLEAQRRFPLDTANHLRGRLRRLHFAVYKKGSKGVSFVCAAKRKFRSPDDNFAEPVVELIEFIEKRPGLHVSKLAEEFLGGGVVEKDKPDSVSAEAKDTESEEKSTDKKSAPKTGEKPAETITKDDPKFLEMGQNLRWLITEGYVVEYSDGKLFAPPLRSPSRESIKNEPEPEAEISDSDSKDKPIPKSQDEPSSADVIPASTEIEEDEKATSIPETEVEAVGETVPEGDPATEPSQDENPVEEPDESMEEDSDSTTELSESEPGYASEDVLPNEDVEIDQDSINPDTSPQSPEEDI